MSTYYAVLGIDPAATRSEIDGAYQRQRERYSPERVAGMDDDIQRMAAQRTAELEQIYGVLSDPQQRQAYDAQIGLSSQHAAPAPVAQPTERGLLSRRERWYAVGGVLVALLLVGLVWMLTDHTERPSVGEVNRPAPDFTLTTLDGTSLDLASYRGSVVLVNFWGTWCEPCVRETPALQRAYERYHDEGLMIIGVNLTEDELVQGNTEADIRAFAEQYRVTYPIALDIDGDVTQAFRVYPLPTSFFIDAAGNIRYVRVGELTEEDVTALFRELQQETAAFRE